MTRSGPPPTLSVVWDFPRFLTGSLMDPWNWQISRVCWAWAWAGLFLVKLTGPEGWRGWTGDAEDHDPRARPVTDVWRGLISSYQN